MQACCKVVWLDWDPLGQDVSAPLLVTLASFSYSFVSPSPPQFAYLGRLAHEVGWKYQAVTATLEEKRKEKAKIHYRKKKQLMVRAGLRLEGHHAFWGRVWELITLDLGLCYALGRLCLRPGVGGPLG